MMAELPDAEILYTLRDFAHDPVAVPVRWYPGGEPLIEHREPYAIGRVLLRPRSMKMLMAGLFFIDAQVARGHPVPELVLPCMPGARQDRLNDVGDALFTAKSMAQMINARGFPRVTVLDPHSDVTPALLDRCHVVHANVASELRVKDVYRGVIAPDGGAEKRAWRVARAAGVPLVHAWKFRDVRTGLISGFGVEPLEAGHYLIMDDLCDGGGTFLGLADELRKSAATADLFVTHGLFSNGTEPLVQRFLRVYCTDSLPGPKPRVHVLPTCLEMLT